MDKYRDEIMSYENNLIRYTKTSYALQLYRSLNKIAIMNGKSVQENTFGLRSPLYFFAKEMQAKKGVAIGIINSS